MGNMLSFVKYTEKPFGNLSRSLSYLSDQSKGLVIFRFFSVNSDQISWIKQYKVFGKTPILLISTSPGRVKIFSTRLDNDLRDFG